MSANAENQTLQNREENAQQTGDNEADLRAKITDYESICRNNNEKFAQLETELKQKDAEIGALKKRITQLEEEASEAQKVKVQHLKESEEVEALKAQSEDTLTRAKGMIFERTKVIKNQELQIEALNQQISSLKDVVTITKDLLEIRNLEVKQLESKIQCMEDKVGAEKERHDLMHKKLEHMIRYNGELKREYETQLCLFSALRERYNERELARGVIDDLRTEVREAAPSTSRENQDEQNRVNGDGEEEEKKKTEVKKE